ncbi:MAG: CapA family protein [Lachnospiraceae bacterium]|nr:CapA family protein [Lachnospiraceae bacterium]
MKTWKKILIADGILALVLVGVLGWGVMTVRKQASEDKKSDEGITTAETLEEDTKKIEQRGLQEAEEAAIAEEKAEAERIAARKAEADRIAAERAEAKKQEEEAQAAAAQAAEEDAANNRVHICMVGDYLLGTLVDDFSLSPEGEYDFNPLFEHVAPYLGAYDLKIINEESACGGREFGISGYPSFNSPHEAQDAIANAGFNCVTLATNHMLDLGPEPVYSTLNYWRGNYPQIATVGAYDSQEASDQIYCFEKNGFRIAVLNYTEVSNGGSGGYYGVPYVLNMLYEDEVRADIRRAKEVSDYVIVAPHWGTEYQLAPDDQQRMWAQIFLEEGVDLVLGTHPHVPEPVEELVREDGHHMICYYSLGNYCSNQALTESLVGAMADVTIRKTPEGVIVEDFGVVPIITHKQRPFTTFLMRDYNSDLSALSYNHTEDPEYSYERCVDLVVSMYGDRLRNYW